MVVLEMLQYNSIEHSQYNVAVICPGGSKRRIPGSKSHQVGNSRSLTHSLRLDELQFAATVVRIKKPTNFLAVFDSFVLNKIKCSPSSNAFLRINTEITNGSREAASSNSSHKA